MLATPHYVVLPNQLYIGTCNINSFRDLEERVQVVTRMKLADGFQNVYETGVKGVGIRLTLTTLQSRPRTQIPIPFELSYPNAANLGIASPGVFTYEFVRTGQQVEGGAAVINLTVKHYMMGYNLSDVTVGGTIRVESERYFSGCSGTENLNISMGRVASTELGKKPARNFNLDVLCSGLPAGTKIPVKVYFEGNADGPGRLNLEPGGAKGVELSLSNEQNTPLPFSRGAAMDMTWTRTQPDGEIYRLPVSAEYVKKPSQKVEPGRANATLNYIIEYD